MESSAIPWSACIILLLPSNLKGFVTIPTVKTPISLAILATIGAAPVPVPPPIPVATNTISAPLIASLISSALSSAASAPFSGSAPAPLPLVIFSPIQIFLPAPERKRACLSVLIAINSTPLTFAEIIRLTALLPPPPTPKTLISTPDSKSLSNSKAIFNPPV